MRQRAWMVMTTLILLALLAGMGRSAAWATDATVALRELKRVDANGIPELVDAVVTVRGNSSGFGAIGSATMATY